MSIPSKCTYCKAPLANLTHENYRFHVVYECGTNSTYDENPNISQPRVHITNNRCTYIAPPGVPENPDDWTDFYKTETYEANAYNAHISLMGERFQWLHELGDAYKTLIEELSKLQPMEHKTLLLVQTCVTCRSELITAFRALARGYAADCRLKTRLAVEYAIFAARAVEKPGAAELWLSAANSEKDWKNYRDNFKIHYLLEKDNAWQVLAELKPQLKRLADDYAHLSQFTHATVLASGLQTSGVRVTLKTAFVERFTEPQFMGIFVELINTHLDLIDLMVKLTKFLKIEIDPKIFKLVKLLEQDVNNLQDWVSEALQSD